MDEIQSIRLKRQDLSYMLSAQQRAEVREDFDPDALEVFLQWIDPSIRGEFLGAFQYQDTQVRAGISRVLMTRFYRISWK